MKKMMIIACAMACAAFMVGCGKADKAAPASSKKANTAPSEEEANERADKSSEEYSAKLHVLFDAAWKQACEGDPHVLIQNESKCWRSIDSTDTIASAGVEDASRGDKKDAFELEDENFRFTSGKKMSEAFEEVREGATLIDLYNFANACCYHGRILPRISQKKPLTKGDLQLLRFVLDVTSSTIVAMSASLLGDMVFEDDPNFALQALSKDHPLFAEYIKSFADASNSRTVIRAQIGRFASRFADVVRKQKFDVFWRADLSTWVSDDSRIRTSWYDNRSVMPVEFACRKIKGDDELGKEWARLCDSAEEYLKFYASIYKVLNAYSPAHSFSKQGVMNILGESGPCRDKTLVTYCLAFYDVPFALVLYRTRYEHRMAKGVLDDSEIAMENALIRLDQSVCGTRMLRHVESAFVLDLYTKCIADIKNEYMREANFNAIINKTALKAKANNTNRFDSNTGLPLNDIAEEKK